MVWRGFRVESLYMDDLSLSSLLTATRIWFRIRLGLNMSLDTSACFRR